MRQVHATQLAARTRQACSRSTPSSTSAHRALFLSLSAILALALLLYGGSLQFGFSYVDDDMLVLGPRAAAVRETPWQALGKSYFDAPERDHAYYRPLVSASFALDGLWSGSEPAGYHATNVLVHVVAAVLVRLLLIAFGYSSATALFGALAFTAHPALAGAVGWIPGRDDMLLTLFALGAWLYLRRARLEQRLSDRVLHGVCFFAALACKEAALALPLVFLLEARVLGKRGFLAALRPWLLPAWGVPLAAYFALRFAVLGPGLGFGGVSLGALASGVPALATGFGQLLLPFAPRVMSAPEDLPLGLGLAALLAFSAAVVGSGARRRRLLFALGAYALLALPSLPAASKLLLESRLYLPAVPLVVALCELGENGRVPAGARGALAAGVVVLLSLATRAHLHVFRDRLAFATAAVEASPHSSLAHRNLGVAEQLAGDREPARLEYRAALALNPDEPLVHNNLAVLLMAEGRLPAAERELEAELAAHPGTPEAEKNLALVRAARNGAKPRP